MYIHRIFAKYLAVKLQTLAALYIVFDIFSAKVCSGAAISGKYLNQTYSHAFLSVYLMYKN